MSRLELKARAKINLTLDILGKRPDGYHEVEMVMQQIELSDTVILEETSGEIEVVTNHPLLLSGQDNIAYKAAKLLAESSGVKRGVKIQIEKNIPVAAGLAGGSTDAAAVLKGLNQLWNLGLSEAELLARGAEIGSDVPFCIKGGTALAQGRGERLSILPDAPELWLVLVKPPIEVSTAGVYRSYDAGRVLTRPLTEAMLAALENNDVTGIVANLANVLESVTLHRYPVVAELKAAVEAAGASRALMSGSGPTVFGVAKGRQEAEDIASRLEGAIPGLFVGVSRTWPASRQEFYGKG